MLLRQTTRFTLIAILCSCCFSLRVSGQNAEFTYQGELRNSGNLANGSFNMNFSLWDAAVGGNQINGTITQNGVLVLAGRFSVELDFGVGAFDNDSRWLEISINGSTLSPRSPITRAPYSLQTRGIFVDSNENVGIGRTDPEHQLDLERSESVIRLTTTDPNPNVLSVLQLKTVDATGAAKPLGRIEFIDQSDTLKAFMQGTKLGAGTVLDLNVTPGLPAGVRISSQGLGVTGDVAVSGDLAIAGDIDASVNPLTVAGDIESTGNLDVDGSISVLGHVGIGINNPESPLQIERFGNQGIDPLVKVVRDAVSPGAAIFAEILDSGSFQTHYAGQFINRNNGGQAAIDVGVWAESASGSGFGIWAEATAPTGTGVRGYAGSQTGVNIGVEGTAGSVNGYDFYASGAGLNYGSSSSRRWKHNIAPVVDPLEMLTQIRGVYFDWDQQHGGHHDIGMIAEEVGKVLPEIVSFEENGVDASGMDYSKLAPLLVEATKALRAEKDREIAELKSRLKQLELVVEQLSAVRR